MARNKSYTYTYESSAGKTKSYSAMELRKRSVGKSLSFAASEAYKLLRTNLMFSMSDESECKIVGVTSALRGEGKSTTSMNLAYSLAENGSKTILVEADMRIPVVAAVFDIAPSPGLSHILAGLGDVKETVRKVGPSENLYVLPAGEIPPNPSEMLSSKRMESLLETLSKEYDYIIIDLPPINAVSDGLAVSKLLSGMIMVVRQDYCNQHALAEAMRQLEFLKVKLLGFVLNGADPQNKRYKYGSGKKYGKRYGAGYGSGYGYYKRSAKKGQPLTDKPDNK
ncbi:MAG: CpsD/CapB family tyrosine-protein kinase [Clostridia bacterium]|nr:CpsD/CapB family tyrosine-protein kinase [Clostridia bacterium]